MCSGINEFSKVYQVKSNLEKDENGGRPADFYRILNGCKNHLSQFLNLLAADDLSKWWAIQLSYYCPRLVLLIW